MKSIEQIKIYNLGFLIQTRFFGKQVAFANAVGINQPNYVSRMLSGDKGIGKDLARQIETALNLPVYWMDNDHSKIEDDDVEIEALSAIANPKEFYKVPLMNAVGSMGNGSDLSDQEVVIDLLRVSKTWVDRAMGQISSINNLAFIHAIGDSMMPTFNDGDILLVDTGNKSIKEDKIFVLEAHNRLFIKRVRQRIDGVYEISSDNPSVKTVDILNGDHDVEIKGRIVWVWNGKKV